jgi:uncharacterized protein (DUF1697 family)
MAPGSRGIAFLRAINVGGNHVVKMDRLKKLFAQAGFTGVETFIASGNVVFDLSPSTKAAAVERTIEAMLLDALGYEVVTFVRTDRELRAAAEHEPFSPGSLKQAKRFNVAFVKQPLDAPAVKTIKALATPVEEFHVRGREIYWLSRVVQSESKVSNAALEKTLRQLSTVRGISTVRMMAEKYGG